MKAREPTPSSNSATDNKNDDDGKGGPLMGLRAALLASKEEIRQLSVVVHQQLGIIKDEEDENEMLKSKIKDLEAQLNDSRNEALKARKEVDVMRDGADAARSDAQRSIEEVEFESSKREATLQAALHDAEVETRLLRAELKKKDHTFKRQEAALQSLLDEAQQRETMSAQTLQSSNAETVSAFKHLQDEKKMACEAAEKSEEIARGLMQDLNARRAG